MFFSLVEMEDFLKNQKGFTSSCSIPTIWLYFPH